MQPNQPGSTLYRKIRYVLSRIHWGSRRILRDTSRKIVIFYRRFRRGVGRFHWSTRRKLRDFLRYSRRWAFLRTCQDWIRQKKNQRDQKLYGKLFNIYARKGVGATLGEIYRGLSSPHAQSHVLVALTRHAMKVNVLDAAVFARTVAEVDKRLARQQWSALAAWDAGDINFSFGLLKTIEATDEGSIPVLEKVRQIKGSWHLFNELPKIPLEKPHSVYTPQSKKVLYVASSSLPYHYTGYTSRTHHLLRAIQAKGWSVHCITRPGYPTDRPDTKGLTEELIHEIDGLIYERVPGNNRREVRYDHYLAEAADKIEQIALRLKPSIIQAASNYEAGLPALIAARRLGIPFVYEVRGLWEYTAASKKPGWEHTERFELDKRLEGHVASHANHVFTLTTAMAEELVSRGASNDKISLVANAIDPSQFTTIDQDEQLKQELGINSDDFVVGYVGSIVAYEGLDDLVTAINLVKKKFSRIKLIIVGDGDVRAELEQMSINAGLTRHITFTGRVTPNEAKKYFSLFDVTALPRKPFQVCNLVSPLKPLEAMITKVPMVVSDVPALAEMVEHEKTALIHKSGNPQSLADALLKLALQPQLREDLANEAYKRVIVDRTWSNVTGSIVIKYEELTS